MPDSRQSVTVVCKVCATRHDEEAFDQPRESICPVCQSLFIIPSASQAASVAPAPAFETDPNLEGYGVIAHDDPQAEARQKKAQDVILVVCPICRARMHVTPKKEPQQLACPDCHELVRVPSRAEHRAKAKKEAIPKPSAVVEPVPTKETSFAERQYSPWYLSAQSDYYREPDPEPPRSLYFSGTFLFPWQPEVRVRWLYLSLGLTAVAAIGFLIYSLYISSAGSMLFVLGFFALPLVWVAIWTASYAAAVWMVVVIDTANGNQKIINWGDQNWREWVMTMLYVEYLSAVAALCGWAAGKTSQYFGGPYWPVCLTVSAMAFPFVVLSALERGGTMNVFSANVATSLFRRPLPWLGYFAIAIALSVGSTYLWWGIVGLSNILAGCIGGLLWSTYLLIQGRLLGRLAWAISRE